MTWIKSNTLYVLAQPLPDGLFNTNSGLCQYGFIKTSHACLIASSGQPSRHVRHSVHISGSMTYCFSSSAMAPIGQFSAQVPHLTHADVILYAMLLCLFTLYLGHDMLCGSVWMISTLMFYILISHPVFSCEVLQWTWMMQLLLPFFVRCFYTISHFVSDIVVMRMSSSPCSM